MRDLSVSSCTRPTRPSPTRRARAPSDRRPTADRRRRSVERGDAPPASPLLPIATARLRRSPVSFARVIGVPFDERAQVGVGPLPQLDQARQIEPGARLPGRIVGRRGDGRLYGHTSWQMSQP